MNGVERPRKRPFNEGSVVFPGIARVLPVCAEFSRGFTEISGATDHALLVRHVQTRLPHVRHVLSAGKHRFGRGRGKFNIRTDHLVISILILWTYCWDVSL